MSYRLSSLPYGLKRRLHELAKPYEQLQLQAASETCLPGFCPPTFRRRFHREAKLTIECTNDVLKTVPICGNTGVDYYVFERELTLRKLTAEHLASDAICWPKLTLRPRIVNISRCELTPEFMAKLAAMIEATVKEVYFQYCTGSVDFEALFKAFPNVEDLKIFGDFSKSWTTDILKYQKCPLKYLRLEGDFKDGDKLFEFADFEKLMSAQPPRFSLILCPLDDPTDAIREIVLQGDCPDLEFDDPEAKAVFVSGSWDGKNSFLYC